MLLIFLCSHLQLSVFSYREIPEKTRPTHRKGYKKIDYDVTVRFGNWKRLVGKSCSCKCCIMGGSTLGPNN